MWDLDSLVRQNNEAALGYMMEGEKSDKVKYPHPKAWSLSFIAEKLKAGPPNLNALLTYFQSVPSMNAFKKMVRGFVPEHEEEIVKAPLSKKVYEYCYWFSKKYFPLPANYNCGVGDIVQNMPVDLLGLSYHTYHDLAMRPGYLILLSLVVYPYPDDDRDLEDDAVPFDPMPSTCARYNPMAPDIAWLRDLVKSLAIKGEWVAPMGFKMVKVADKEIELQEAVDDPNVREAIQRTLVVAERAGIKTKFKVGRKAAEKMSGARVPLLDKVQGIVGAATAARIPWNGWMPEDLHKLTDNSRFDGVGDFADWATSQTGCTLLDANYEDCQYVEGLGEPLFKWTHRNVDILTEQWPRLQQIRLKIDHLVAWLELDPPNNFRDLLDYILEQPEPKKKNSKLRRGMDSPWEFMTLDEITEEDQEEEDGNEDE